MADAYIRLPTDALGKRLRTVEHNVNGESVHAEVVVLATPDGVLATKTLTERMLAKAPAPGYSLAWDLADPLYMYFAEAPVGSAETAPVWRGIRAPITSGVVRERTNFAWADRGTGW